MIIVDEFNKIKSISEYKVLKTLYLGKLSQVYLVENKNGKKLILKAIKNHYNIKRIINEINILRVLNKEKNISKLLHVFKDSNIYFFIFEYYKDGDLKSLVKNKSPLKEEDIYFVLKDILNVLKYLKTINIIHKDIKAENIFKENDRYILGDWGLSENKNRIKTLHIKSDDKIVSPEMFKGLYSFETDIYSLGCTLYYLATGKSVYEIDKDSSYAYIMYAHCKLHIDLTLISSSKLRNIISQMTKKEPNQRATIEDIENILFLNEEYNLNNYNTNYMLYKKKEPKELYKELEKDDNLYAINNLGLLYELEKNFQLAKEKYKYAANRGFIKAMYNLGLYYYMGKGEDKDFKKAYEWIEKAAVNGHEKAQFILASFFENGIFVLKNLEKAQSLYIISAKNGCKEAHKKVKNLLKTNI